MRTWLKEERVKQRLTQKQVADAIGVTESFYSLVEANKRQKKMDITLAARLANVLGMEVNEIVRKEAENESHR